MKDNERKINIDDVLVHSAKFIKDNFIPKKNEESFNIKKKDDKTNYKKTKHFRHFGAAQQKR